MIDCKDKLFELLNELEKVHPDLYRKNTKEVIKEFINSCPDKCSNEELLLNVLRLTSIIGDPHTVPILASNAKCVFKMIQDGLYIANATDKNIINCKLVSINGVSVQELNDVFLRYIRFDNQSRLNTEICDLFANELFLKCFFKSDIVFDLLSGDKHIMYNYSRLCNSLDILDKENSYFYDENNNALYIKIETLDSKVSDVEKFANDLKRYICDNSVQNIMIDLRGNNGGSEVALESKEGSESFYKLIEEKNVITFVDERTFSSASKVAQKLRMNGSKIIGETMGQTENHFGDCKQIEIPGTNIKVLCSTKEYVLVDGKHYGLSKSGNYTYDEAEKYGITMDKIKQRNDYKLDYYIKPYNPKEWLSIMDNANDMKM